MHRMRYACLTLGLLVGTVLGPRPSNAQYSADFQTNIISGVTSNWTGSYFVGNTNSADVLVIEKNGVLNSGEGYLGYHATASNNSVVVTGAGSVWSNSSAIVVGDSGTRNSLVISNGGRVFSSDEFSGSGFVGGKAGGSGNNVLVTGVGSMWSNRADLVIGVTGVSNNLAIIDGGQVFSRNGIFNLPIGALPGVASGLLISGTGSVWNCSGTLSVSGADNSLVISNGGRMACFSSSVGYMGNNNDMLVTGAGSVWSNRFELSIGNSLDSRRGSQSLIIADGGQVVDLVAFVGDHTSSNSARVVNGGVWQNSNLYVGYLGSSNSLFVAGGTVFATSLTVGFLSPLCNNLVQLDSGTIIVTNISTNAVLDVQQGKFILNGGTLQVDRFVMTNACAQFIHTGGTLIYGTAVLDPVRDDDGDGIPNGWEQSHGLDPLNAADANVDSDGDGFTNLQEYLAGTDPHDNGSALRITSILQVDSNVLVSWTMGSGKTNSLQWTEGISGSYATNNFADIFIVTNTVGSVTNYLDVGGATNDPARYYRVRLVL